MGGAGWRGGTLAGLARAELTNAGGLAQTWLHCGEADGDRQGGLSTRQTTRGGPDQQTDRQTEGASRIRSFLACAHTCTRVCCSLLRVRGLPALAGPHRVHPPPWWRLAPRKPGIPETLAHACAHVKGQHAHGCRWGGWRGPPSDSHRAKTGPVRPQEPPGGGEQA